MEPGSRGDEKRSSEHIWRCTEVVNFDQLNYDHGFCRNFTIIYQQNYNQFGISLFEKFIMNLWRQMKSFLISNRNIDSVTIYATAQYILIGFIN